MKRIKEMVAMIVMIAMFTACSGKNLGTLRTVGEAAMSPIVTDNKNNIERSDILFESIGGSISRISIDSNSSSNSGGAKFCIAGDNQTLRYVSEVLDYNDGEALAALRGLILGDQKSTEKVIKLLKGRTTRTNGKDGDVPLMLGVTIPKPKFTTEEFKTFSEEKQNSELMGYMISLIEAIKKANKRLDNIRAWQRNKK